jgi:hypothetical protein
MGVAPNDPVPENKDVCPSSGWQVGGTSTRMLQRKTRGDGRARFSFTMAEEMKTFSKFERTTSGEWSMPDPTKRDSRSGLRSTRAGGKTKQAAHTWAIEYRKTPRDKLPMMQLSQLETIYGRKRPLVETNVSIVCVACADYDRKGLRLGTYLLPGVRRRLTWRISRLNCLTRDFIYDKSFAHGRVIRPLFTETKVFIITTCSQVV